MKLYFAPNACSLADHIALLEVGATFETEGVDIRTKRTESGVTSRAVSTGRDRDDGCRDFSSFALRYNEMAIEHRTCPASHTDFADHTAAPPCLRTRKRGGSTNEQSEDWWAGTTPIAAQPLTRRQSQRADQAILGVDPAAKNDRYP